MTYYYIDNKQRLSDFRETLRQNNTKAVCMDFEGEFNLHCYGEKLCLIQVFDGRTFYVIDPFRIGKTELTEMLESDIVKIFYSAGSDRKLVFNQYGIRIKSLLDISDLVEVVGIPHKSLGSLLEELLSVKIEKKNRYQRYNWTLRPIDEDAIQYALSDVRYLFELKDVLIKKIKEHDLVESLAYRLAKAEFDYEKRSIPGVKKKPRYMKLGQKDKSLFEAVYSIRERFAKDMNIPPNSVFSNEQVFQIAERKLHIENIQFGKEVAPLLRKEIIKEISRGNV